MDQNALIEEFQRRRKLALLRWNQCLAPAVFLFLSVFLIETLWLPGFFDRLYIFVPVGIVMLALLGAGLYFFRQCRCPNCDEAVLGFRYPAIDPFVCPDCGAQLRSQARWFDKL